MTEKEFTYIVYHHMYYDHGSLPDAFSLFLGNRNGFFLREYDET